MIKYSHPSMPPTPYPVLYKRASEEIFVLATVGAIFSFSKMPACLVSRSVRVARRYSTDSVPRLHPRSV